MTYILLLALLFSGIIATAIGHNPVSELVHKIQGNITEIAFPKNSREIIIDNLEGKYKTLDQFFSGSANELIKSKNISENNKKQIQEAFKAYTESKSLLNNLKVKEQAQKGIIESVIKKVLKTDEEQPGPTSIPPQCRVECPGN